MRNVAEIAACGINRVPDAVLFVVVDADEGGGFGDDGWWSMGCGSHGTDTIPN